MSDRINVVEIIRAEYMSYFKGISVKSIHTLKAMLECAMPLLVASHNDFKFSTSQILELKQSPTIGVLSIPNRYGRSITGYLFIAICLYLSSGITFSIQSYNQNNEALPHIKKFFAQLCGGGGRILRSNNKEFLTYCGGETVGVVPPETLINRGCFNNVTVSPIDLQRFIHPITTVYTISTFTLMSCRQTSDYTVAFLKRVISNNQAFTVPFYFPKHRQNNVDGTLSPIGKICDNCQRAELDDPSQCIHDTVVDMKYMSVDAATFITDYHFSG